MKNIIKYACFYAIGLWGIASLIYLSGEPIDENMPLGTFCICKLAGFASLGLCLLVGKILDRKGLLLTNNTDDDVSL